MRYWSVMSLMRLNSRMHRVTAFVLVGSRNARTSGLRLQNLFCDTDSLDWPAGISFSSDCVKGRLVSCSLATFQMESGEMFSHWSSSSNSSVSSFQIVSSVFSPEMHMNLHSVEVNLVSSPCRVSNNYGGLLCGSRRGFRTCVGCGLDPGLGGPFLM
jgi:hypothetical protein